MFNRVVCESPQCTGDVVAGMDVKWQQDEYCGKLQEMMPTCKISFFSLDTNIFQNSVMQNIMIFIVQQGRCDSWNGMSYRELVSGQAVAAESQHTIGSEN